MKKLIRTVTKTTWYGLFAGIGLLAMYATDTDRFTAAYVLIGILWAMFGITLYANEKV